MNKKPEAFFVVSNWNNDLSWITDYTQDYLIYDKSGKLPENDKIIKLNNVGFNIYDIFDFIINNYDDLPEIVAFLQGHPFDHCKRETFDKLIYNTKFTALEDYSHVSESHAHKKTPQGKYLEINTSWYLVLPKPYKRRYFTSYNQFLDYMFVNPEFPQWIRFAPGAQYVIPKTNILKYSPMFYAKLRSFVAYDSHPMEAHLIERAMHTIFSNQYEEKYAK